jgi:hypothetical protein
VNGSTPGRVSPTGSYILSVFNDAWHGRVAVRIGEHLGTPRFVVLRVVIDERNAFGNVVITSLLTVRASRLGVDN